MKAPSPLEHQIQSSYFEWARHPLTLKKYPELRWLHAIPNGGSRHVVEAVNLKKGGVLKGILDVCLPCRGGIHSEYGGRQYTTLRIEFKRLGEKVTVEQREFFEFCESEGQKCVVCFDAEIAIKITKEYLSNGVS